ncbi:MAG: Ig-like domain-containing protein, partial [Anaerolineae bacterium]
MTRRRSHQVITTIVALTLLVGACARQPTPEPSPTFAPYTPPPEGSVAPRVIQRTPERGEELPPDGRIELVFDRAMDRSSVETALHVGPGVSGSFEWADGRTVRFKPGRHLKRDQEYVVTVDAQAKAADGESLDGAYRFDFRTVGYLEVSQVVPAAGAADVEAESTITVMFNRPVIPLTAVSDPAYEDLPQPLLIDPPVEGRGEWLNTSIYTFTPEEAMAGGTTYRARIQAGLTDTTGGVIDQDYVWTFTTQPPQVTWVSPEEGAELVSVEPVFEVTFNGPVDPASAERAFSLRDGGEVVDGAFQVVSDTLVFTPTDRLAFDTTYTARVDAGVRSVGGGEGMPNPYQWRFTTVPLPRIVRTNPSDGQRAVDPYRPLEIVFNTPIDPATVMPNLEMTPPLSPTQVHTYFYDTTFVLNFNSQPSTDYQVRIGPDVADPYGNTIGEEWTVRFRTAPLDPQVQLDVPGTIGTYDASQPARILVGHVNTERVDLRLHRMDGVEEFLEIQDSFWDAQSPGGLLREWSVSVEAPLDEKRHTPVDLVEGGGQLDPGIYLLEVRAPDVKFEPWMHRRLLSVSNHNLTVKSSRDEVWAWATELETGRPASGLALTVWGMEGESVGPVSTDRDGLAHFELDTEARHTLYVISEDPFVLGGVGREWEQGIRPWDFGLQSGYDEREHRVHVTTDRPLYRAGQTVYFRGIVRAQDDVRYSLPSQETVGVRVDSAQGETVYDQDLALDAYGTFHGELTLEEGASLGEYRIVAEVGGATYHSSFTVSAYRPPEFEVTVTPEEAELGSGQPTRAEVDVSYYFGGPVADVDVEWRVLSAPYVFRPDQFGRYDFTDQDDPWICFWCWWREPPRPEPILTGSGTTDAEGHLSIGLPTAVMTGGQQLTVEATAYGRDGQAISGREDLVVHRGDFYVGLAPQERVGEAGEEMGVDVVTVDWDGRRVPDRALDVEVYRREWINTFVEDEDGGGRWEWETEDTLVYTDTLTTDRRAEGEVAFTPEEGGSYRVSVSGRDARERRVVSSIWVWVSSREDVSWRREDNDRFDLISDKATYVPGETAEILIPSPFQGEQWAWITVEREGVLEHEVRRLESNSAIYRLPITARHAPNVYVSVVIVKAPSLPALLPEGEGSGQPVATHKVGYVALTVEPVEQTLDVRITKTLEGSETFRGSDAAEPGSTVSFDVEARDASGAPVEAVFSLDLVDKAVLSLKPRQEDTVLETFYGRRGIGVWTSSGLVLSVNRILLKQMEELEDLAMQGLGLGGGGAVEEAQVEAPAAMPAREAADTGERAADEQLPEGVELRERFEDTAFWDAT